MNLTYELSVRAEVAEPLFVGAGPLGMRMVGPVTGGTFEGERLRGTVLGSGADWLLVRPDGWGNIDVRMQLRTDDGAVIYVSYTGLLHITDAVGRALGSDESTDYADQYWRTTPRLETGDPRYAWVNNTLFVAEGRVGVGRAVEYRVYRIE